MTKSAKIISLILCIVMVLSVASAMVISSFAADAPSLAVKKISEKGDEIVVSINLASGSFNSMDIVFNMKGLTCKDISAGQATTGAGATLISNPNATGGKSHISMVALNGMSTGSIAIVTLEKDREDYSFSISVTDCAVSDENYNNIPVTPSISGNSIVPPTTKTTTTTTKKTTTTTTTKKTTTTEKDDDNTKKTTTTTTKKGTTTTTKKGTTTTTTTGSLIPTGTLPADITAISDVTSSSVVDESSSGLDYDSYGNSEYEYDYNYNTPDENTEAVDGDGEELLDDSKDPKTLIIIAAIVVVLIAGAVVAFILINKKKNAE